MIYCLVMNTETHRGKFVKSNLLVTIEKYVETLDNYEILVTLTSEDRVDGLFTNEVTFIDGIEGVRYERKKL